jgi:hypothetical protein
MVAMRSAIWAAGLINPLVGTTAVASLPGGFLTEHMQETLSFGRRFFYELDPAQAAAIRTHRDKLARWSYTAKELRETKIIQGNIFDDTGAGEADHAYYDWDITGTIKEAESYGLVKAITAAAQSPGTRCLALTVSVRRVGTDYTVKRWAKLVKAAVKDQPSRVVVVEEPVGYGGQYRSTARMVLLRAIIKPGGESYNQRAGKLSRMRTRTVERIYRDTVGRRGRLPQRKVMESRILASEFPPVIPAPPVISFDRADLERRQTRTIKRHYKAHVQPGRGRYPAREKMINRLVAL